VTTWIQDRLSSILPKISPTEREALEAGSPGYEAQLLSGRFELPKLQSIPLLPFTREEKAFLENEVVELCRHLSEWEIQKDLDLPAAAWEFIRTKGFMGLCIPTEYGGKGFSARAHAEVVARIAAVSPTAAITVMVPNSLGPAELLLHYGTQEQRNEHLPRLATGQEIPCFALTSPWAGSDAANIPDTGLVCLRENPPWG
jgi:acyl-CoA dehydrogenase